MRRRIVDARLGLVGRACGEAVFAKCGFGLRCDETTLLRFGAFEGAGSRALMFLFDGARLRVRFEDGRPFFEADLSGGRAAIAHACPPDAYHGEMRLRGADRWTQLWRVRGPRKALTIATRYVREAA